MSQLSLWKFTLIPALLAIALAALFIWGGWYFANDIGAAIASIWPFEFGASFFRSLSNFVGGLSVLVVGFFTFKHLLMAICGPFMAPISQRVEDHLNGEKVVSEIGFMSSLVRSVRINIRLILIELLVSIPLILLSFIPMLNILSSILLFYASSYFTGFGAMDYCLERHFKTSDSVKFVRANKGLATGNGIIFNLILLIPVVGVLIVLPVSTAAATVSTYNRWK
jgi:CysZ protein